jgi:hypothetical protein
MTGIRFASLLVVAITALLSVPITAQNESYRESRRAN